MKNGLLFTLPCGAPSLYYELYLVSFGLFWFTCFFELPGYMWSFSEPQHGPWLLKSFSQICRKLQFNQVRLNKITKFNHAFILGIYIYSYWTSIHEYYINFKSGVKLNQARWFKWLSLSLSLFLFFLSFSSSFYFLFIFFLFLAPNATPGNSCSFI